MLFDSILYDNFDKHTVMIKKKKKKKNQVYTSDYISGLYLALEALRKNLTIIS